MKFGKLDFNPAENPAVLDTATWDPEAARRTLRESNLDWARASRALAQGAPQQAGEIRFHTGSVAQTPESVSWLVSLPDGQDVFVQVGHGPELGNPLVSQALPSGQPLTAFPTQASVVDRFVRQLTPRKGAQRLASTPRLGIGTRMTTSLWPGIFAAMAKRGFAANAIQNSVRELDLLESLLAGAPPEKNYSTGIGTIECGWTGSTYEGLWVAGVLAALKWNRPLRYGADADHIQVKRGVDGMERAKRVIRAARYYSFYTLDLADVLNYDALQPCSPTVAEAFLTQKIPNPVERRGILECHTKPCRLPGLTLHLDAATVGRCVGKYWDALDTLAALANFITSLRDWQPFDLELTIDEHPPEVAAFDCLTTDEEVLFLAREIHRRRLPVSHLAPNFGQEKGCDYRCPDGLAGLERRVQRQFQLAREHGLLLDVHSGDDLGRDARRVFQRATGGQLHFKISPRLQLLYAELLQAYHPDLFCRWWQDALAYAQRESASGSPVARRCLAALNTDSNHRPSWQDPVFQSFSFPFVGRRDATGQFIRRHEFYRLSAAFNEAYQQRVSDDLCELADDLF